MPEYHPPNLEQLDLENNKLTDVYDNDLRWATHLKYCYLHRNRLTEVPNVSYLSNLRRLYLDRNDISFINTSSLLGLTSLTHLYLYQNDISYVNFSSLHGLNSLAYLYLDRNDIVHVDLPSLPAISKVRLYGNNIAGIDEDVWQNIRNVKVLEIKYNNLEGSLNISALVNLETLSASNNMIDSIILTSHSQLATIDLSNNKLDQFPPLINNYSVPALNILDLSENPFTGSMITPYLPSLTKLTLDHMAIQEIQFSEGSPITHLNLNHNQFDTLPILEALASTLVSLKLEHNAINSVNRSAFSNMSNLEELYLTGMLS